MDCETRIENNNLDVYKLYNIYMASCIKMHHLWLSPTRVNYFSKILYHTCFSFFRRTSLENWLPGNTLVCITYANHNPTPNHKLYTTKYCPFAGSLATLFLFFFCILNYKSFHAIIVHVQCSNLYLPTFIIAVV